MHLFKRSPATGEISVRAHIPLSAPPGALRSLRLALIAAPAMLLAACGGAGGPGPSSVSSGTPPAPAPTPTVNYDTAEYRRSSAAVDSGVLPAWQAGVSGAGVTIGFIDSGLTDALGEFTGRISALSRDVTGQGRSLADSSGHGTAVAGVAAAARNESGIVGLAPGVTIAMMRADNGDCANGCRYTDSALAAGMDAAVAAGAKVVNISLGGSSANTALRSAFARAAAAGTVIVISAGNDGNREVDPLPAAALAAGSGANVIIVGSASPSGTISSFSNRAGSSQSNYILALGEDVRSFDNEGTAYLYSGTSFAAPSVTAAVALLAQAFPNLSASRLVELVLSSADDAGDIGTDSIYGRGLLNIGRAMAPSGATSLAGTSIPVLLTPSGSLGSAFGNGLATSSGLSGIPITDRFDRLYTVSLGQSLRPASPSRLVGRLASAGLQSASTELHGGPVSVSLLLRATDQVDQAGVDHFRNDDHSVAHLGFAQRGVDARAGSRNPLSETRLRVQATGGLGFVAATGRLAAESLPGAVAGGFVADDGLSPDEGTGVNGRQLLMAEHRQGAFAFALAASQRRYSLPRSNGLSHDAMQSRVTLAAAYARGPWRLALHAADLQDDGALLGTRLSESFGLLGGRTRSLGLAAGYERGGYALRLAGSQGWVDPRFAEAGLLAASDKLRVQSWSLTGEAPAGPGRLSLRVAGPMAVSGGRFLLANGTPVAVAATARETATELGYAVGSLSLAAFHRQNAGNLPGLADTGAAFTFRTDF